MVFAGLYALAPNVLDALKIVKPEDKVPAWPELSYLAPDALNDFQKLSDEAFRSMTDKYYRPADLIADMRSRRFLKLKARR